MRVLVFDPFNGAAGDMIIGALLDCGADKNRVMRAMQCIIAEPSITHVTRAGIQAVKVDTHASPAQRTLSEVMQRIDEAAPDLPPEVLAMAKRVFERIMMLSIGFMVPMLTSMKWELMMQSLM